MPSPKEKVGESICSYIFTRVDALLTEFSRPRTAFAAFVLHASFYSLVSEVVESGGFYRYFEAHLCKEAQAFSDPERVQKLWHDAHAAMAPMCALLVGDYGDVSSISEYLKHAALFAFDHFDESQWDGRYEKPFLNAGADVIDFALNALDRYKLESLSTSPSQKASRPSRAPYIVAVIAVVVSIVSIIIAISASRSTGSSPSAASPPAASAESAEPVTTASSSVPTSKPASSSADSVPVRQLEALPLPTNGLHFPTYDLSSAAKSSICVHAPSTSNCFVIIKRHSSGKILDRFFVRSGSTVDTYCPKGTLDIYFAFGNDWYGTDLLFGDDTYCQVDREIKFTETISYEYTLDLVPDGNLHMPDVSIDEALSG